MSGSTNLTSDMVEQGLVYNDDEIVAEPNETANNNAQEEPTTARPCVFSRVLDVGRAAT
jgi:hypothetical protein